MSAQVQRWLEHIRVLAVDIGPRGPTTEGERLGAEYCASAMRQLGLEPQVEGFTSARSIFQPHLLTAGAMLLSFAIYPLAGRASAALAALISLGALASDLLELSFSDNPLRRIVAKGPSQNVVTTIAPAAEHRQDLVLIGHIDTQRTPIVFSTPRWVAAYKAFTWNAAAWKCRRKNICAVWEELQGRRPTRYCQFPDNESYGPMSRSWRTPKYVVSPWQRRHG